MSFINLAKLDDLTVRRMNMVLTFTIAFMMLAYGLCWSTIINIPDDYLTIQEGIDASTDGDTVLVQPGTYVENINFNGHNIVLGSLFLMTGDTPYISSTIIDGSNQSGSVISFENGEDSTATIIGFTIENGYSVFGGGIECAFSDPTIEHNHIQNNVVHFDDMVAGAGICCWGSNPVISGNIISGNECTGFMGWGGGIALFDSPNPLIINNIITDNNGHLGGGGIFCDNSALRLIDNTISGNTAGEGGGIVFYNSDLGESSIISGNVISYNVGGGISFHCHASISNNTIVANSGGYYPAGIVCQNDIDVQVLNTIVWENESQIYLEDNSIIEITYSDIQGGWQGEGNINCDPEFCDPEAGNFYLSENSCCVGAGQGGVDIGALGVGCGFCNYIAGDCNHNGIPLELGDVITMIGTYRGTTPDPFTCPCPPHGDYFPATVDPDGNCVPNELTDVVTEITAYRGTTTASSCPDCPGSLRLIQEHDDSSP